MSLQWMLIVTNLANLIPNFLCVYYSTARDVFAHMQSTITTSNCEILITSVIINAVL